MQRKIKYIFYVCTIFFFFFRKSNDVIKSNLKIAPKFLGWNVNVEFDEVVVVQHTGERSGWRHSFVGKTWVDIARKGYSVCTIRDYGFDLLGSG